MTAPVTPTLAVVAPDALADLADLAERAEGYARDSLAESTQVAYRRDQQRFAEWAAVHGLPSLPASPGTVAAYATALADAGQRPSTIGRRLAAIGYAHRAANKPSPLADSRVRVVMAGIRRRLGTAAEHQKAALVVSQIAALASQASATPKGVRDRALLTVGFFGALRRSELVALDVADVCFSPEGVTLLIRRSKVDQDGDGEEVAIPFMGDLALCAARSLRAWLDLAQIAEGPIFRPISRHGRIAAERLSDRAVALVVQSLARSAGIDADVAAHSLRAGFATSAAAAGKSERSIMAQGRWKSVTVARRYIRHGSRFRDNAAEGLA